MKISYKGLSLDQYPSRILSIDSSAKTVTVQYQVPELFDNMIGRCGSLVKPILIEYRYIGKSQVWSQILDIEIPGSVVYGGHRYYTWDQFMLLNDYLPDGWRLPTVVDFEILDSEYSNDTLKLVHSGWILGGNVNNDGSFSNATSYGYYWSSSYYNTKNAYYLFFNSGGNINPKYNAYKDNRFLVRAIKCE